MFSSFTGRLIPKAIVFCADNSQDAAFAEKLKNALPNTDITISFGNGSNQFENDSFDIAVVRSLTNVDTSLELFFEVFRILKASGNFYYFNAVRTFEISEKLNSNLMISGFADTVVTQEDEQALFTSNKPNWSLGATEGITIKPTKKVDWSSVGDGEQINENDLLMDEDLVKPTVISASDCTTTKKACKNCSCGRAEMEQAEEAKKVKITVDMIERPGLESSCGSCGLGDAFRCNGCPYRGLPSFKPGEKITLPDDFFQDDI